MPEVSRRGLLGGAAAMAGVAAAIGLPPNMAKAVAATQNDPPTSFDLSDVKHVVILMQENRSFDHYFGTLSGVRGFSDPAARSVLYQPDPYNPDGYLLPYHLDTGTTAAAAIPSTNHSWGPQHSALNGGANNNWVPAHYAADGSVNYQYVMGYYERRDLPFHYALADNFTICDNYYCGVLGPTYSNRIFHLSGTIDPNGEHGARLSTTGPPTACATGSATPRHCRTPG